MAKKKQSHEPHFVCPNDGRLTQNEVTFLCNKCDGSDVIFVDGMYMCPKCLEQAEPFQCRICKSKKVALFLKNLPQ